MFNIVDVYFSFFFFFFSRFEAWKESFVNSKQIIEIKAQERNNMWIFLLTLYSLIGYFINTNVVFVFQFWVGLILILFVRQGLSGGSLRYLFDAGFIGKAI